MRRIDHREKADIELREQLADIREQLFQSRFRSGQDEVEERGKFRKLRREVARILTVLRERQLSVRGQTSAVGARAEEKQA